MTTARTVRLLQVRYAPSPEGPWSEPSTNTTGHELSSLWCKPEWYGNDPEKAYRQDRVIDLPLPPDDPPSPACDRCELEREFGTGGLLPRHTCGIGDPPSPASEGEVGEQEPAFVRRVRSWLGMGADTRASDIIGLDLSDAEELLAYLREAAGVREQLELAERLLGLGVALPHERPPYAPDGYGYEVLATLHELGFQPPHDAKERLRDLMSRAVDHGIAEKERAESAEKRLAEAEALLLTAREHAAYWEKRWRDETGSDEK